MPNDGHYTLCPYFVGHKDKSISCEDIYRRFESHKDKENHMSKYCDDKWESCPHAVNLMRMYERIDNMSDIEAKYEKLRVKYEGTKKEIDSLSKKIGKLEKREFELTKDKNLLEVLYLKYKNFVDQGAKKEEKIIEELKQMTDLYEARFAFLISKCGELDEEEFDIWINATEWALVPEVEEIEGKAKVKKWKVAIKEEIKERNQKNDNKRNTTKKNS